MEIDRQFSEICKSCDFVSESRATFSFTIDKTNRKNEYPYQCTKIQNIYSLLVSPICFLYSRYQLIASSNPSWMVYGGLKPVLLSFFDEKSRS
mgnify:CR=1 FL=1